MTTRNGEGWSETTYSPQEFQAVTEQSAPSLAEIEREWDAAEKHATAGNVGVSIRTDGRHNIVVRTDW